MNTIARSRHVLAPAGLLIGSLAVSAAPAAASPAASAAGSNQGQQIAAAITPKTSRTMAAKMVGPHKWNQRQFVCLDKLWTKESGWNYRAQNRYSGAYGIPQALPGRKMASAGKDWRTNPATQVRWGIGYIKGRYGNPCAAWSHSQTRGWY